MATSSDSSCPGDRPSSPPLARVKSEETRQRELEKRQREYVVPPLMLEALGGKWSLLPPFAGSRDQFYTWVADPVMWMRIVMADFGSGAAGSRVRQRFGQLHTAMHDAVDASGFLLWRSFPPRRQMAVTLKQAGLPPRRLELPAVTFKQAKMARSSRFGREWTMRTLPARWASAPTAPLWVKQARRLIEGARFSFMGSQLPLVDHRWSDDRFSRSDASIHALCSGEDDDALVVAASVSSPFPADRLLRALLADKDMDIVYIDVICSVERGAGYRLLADIVAMLQEAQPERRLVLVLMAVVSSDVLNCYTRWGFSYGGIIERGADQPPLVVDRIRELRAELLRFEAAAIDFKTATSLREE